MKHFSLLPFIFAFGALLAVGARVKADAPWHPANGPLMTRWAKLVSPTNALPDYPRPQMTRPDWQNLNGLWDYAVTDKSAEAAPMAYDGHILVPYPIESALSGVMKPFQPTQRLWYRRTFTVPDAWAGRHVLLHFGAVDWDAQVFVNGQSVGGHKGGYDAFTFDITKHLKPGANEITVSVLDPTDTNWQLKGKQTLHPGGAAYTAVSGIWQTVWLEPVAASAIESLHLVPDLANHVLYVTVNARIMPHPMTVSVTVVEGANPVAGVKCPIGAELTPDVQNQLVDWYKATNALVTTTLDVPLPNPHLWTPDDPFLYSFTVTLRDSDGTSTDTVGSYFGMRSLALGKDAKGNMRFLLNGKETMLPMVLDQGFWPDGIYTAPTDDALRFDLEAEKQLGVHVRKHVKVEPDRWYYWADKLGVLVLQDMPTGAEGDPYTDRPTSPEAAAQCESEMRALIQQRWNHPSIISWNMFNEGWGQHDTVATAAWAKSLDPSRLIDEASGFPWHGAGDIRDCHGGVPPKSATQISIDTENGSVGVSTPGHDWPLGKLWTPITYDPATGGEAKPVEDQLPPLDSGAKQWFTRRVRSQFHALWANRDNTGQTGDSYCQITDVETEEDGLLSYDRAVWKVDPVPIRAAARGEGLAANVTFLVPTAAVKPTTWRYTTTKPADDWPAPKFDDGGWKTGLSAFGSGYDNIHTPWTDTPGDIWLRQTFTLAQKPSGPLLVRMIHDEDAEVYLNGVLACRDSGYIGSPDDFAVNTQAAATLKTGSNVITVHCRQETGGQVIDVGLVQVKLP